MRTGSVGRGIRERGRYVVMGQSLHIFDVRVASAFPPDSDRIAMLR